MSVRVDCHLLNYDRSPEAAESYLIASVVFVVTHSPGGSFCVMLKQIC